MTTTRRAIILNLPLLFLSAWATSAQPPEPPAKTTLLKRGLLGSGLKPGLALEAALLQVAPVQKEIKLTSSQKERLKQAMLDGDRLVKRLNEEVRIRSLEIRAQEGDEASRAYVFQFLTSMNSLTSPRDELLMKVLEPPRRTRLEQIQIQCEGPFTFTRLEIHKRLNLSPEQVEAIVAIVEQGREAMSQAASVPDGAVPRRLGPQERSSLLQSKTFQADLAKSREAVKNPVVRPCR
jgi:hypothetical protein